MDVHYRYIPSSFPPISFLLPSSLSPSFPSFLMRLSSLPPYFSFSAKQCSMTESVIMKITSPGAGLLDCQIWFSHLLRVWPWTRHFSSLACNLGEQCLLPGASHFSSLIIIPLRTVSQYVTHTPQMTVSLRWFSVFSDKGINNTVLQSEMLLFSLNPSKNSRIKSQRRVLFSNTFVTLVH